MRVKFIDLERQHGPMREELVSAFERVLGSNQFILGPELKEFEQEICALTGARHAVGVSNGTNALLLCLKAFGIAEGDEVITTPFTFIATAEVVALVGAKPVFCDIEPKTFNIDVGKIRNCIAGRTRAIIPVHLYGQVADMDEVNRVAKDHNVRVIEDMAQALGAKYKGRQAGVFSDAACISFYVTKNLSALGDAGMILTNEDGLAEKLRAYRVHGALKKYHHDILGYNDRLDEVQAAFLRIKLRRLEAWNERRREIAARYDAGLKDLVTVPLVREHNETVYHQYTIRTSKRDALEQFLEAKGVGTAVHYPVPLHLQPAFRYLGYCEGDFPEAEKAAREVLCLPIHQDLTDEEVDYVISCVRDFFRT
ncbi:MAG: DegT/DnrJ/EryC1/StrS family aminotransferase [Dehalococcoidia bacterium]|nr:DegT/DnrJ/EryC1/StrS family aminotransferase [Dehalococcoidia bacterium]